MRRLLPGAAAAFAVAAFAAGFFAPELRAQGGLPEAFWPMRASGRPELEPMRAYTRTVQLLQERYYGALPGERRLTYLAIRGMLRTLDDPYTRFLEPAEYRALLEENEGEYAGIGIDVDTRPTRDGYFRVRAVQTPAAQKAGMQAGDLITAVDGKPVRGLTGAEVRDLTEGEEGTSVRLTVIHPTETRPAQIRITRHLVEMPVVKFRMERGGIGYVSLSQFNEIADTRLTQAVKELDRKGMRALVLDLRGNPGGLLDSAIDIASRFIPPSRKVVTIVESQGNPEVRSTSATRYLGGKWPLVVLVSRTSASATEILSAAIQENRVGTVVGTVTFGKGLVQSVLPLRDGAGCVITTARYLTPSGRDINRSPGQRGGVQPDFVVEVSEEQFRRGEDPQLRKAQELLMEKLARR